MKSEELREIIRQLSKNYRDNRSSLPQPDVLEKELHCLSGIESSDPHTLLLIPIDSPYLEHMGSACGYKGNRIFSDKSVVVFLKKKNVKQIVGILYGPDLDGYFNGSDNGSIDCSSVALPIVGRDGHIFESMICKRNGSFRYERSKVPDWSVYESE